MSADTIPVVYFVRHATPDWSRTDISYFVPPGPPLTLQGEGEAEQLGAFLREMGVRTLFSSPLERCQQTAQIVAGAVNSSYSIESGLAEWKPGEREAEVMARLWPVWEQAHQLSGRAGPVALITHGGPIALALAALGLEALVLDHYKNLFDRRNPLPPAGAWRAERFTGAAPWNLTLAFVPEAYRKQILV